MPRKNKNARPRNIRIRSRKGAGDHLRLLDPFYQPVESLPSCGLDRQSEILNKPVKKPGSTIKVTPEQIVRDFRKNEGLDVYAQSASIRPIFSNRYKLFSRPFFLIRWLRAIDWGFFWPWRRA
jgi:hypothetical protein